MPADAFVPDLHSLERRNEIERFFRRWKGFRRIFPRFEKLDAVLLGLIVFALVVVRYDRVNMFQSLCTVVLIDGILGI